jgi:hypothetical protein
VIELVCIDPDGFLELRNLGLINEQIRYKQQFFVPADGAAKSEPTLEDCLGIASQTKAPNRPPLLREWYFPLTGETHHHFDLDHNFRLIESLDANCRDAGHRPPEQFT